MRLSSFQLQRLGMARLVLKAIESSAGRKLLLILPHVHMQVIDLPKRGLSKGNMKGHGEAARPTWEDSKEWVGKRAVGTEGLAKGKAEEERARLRESWLTRTREGGRQKTNREGEATKGEGREICMDGRRDWRRGER